MDLDDHLLGDRVWSGESETNAISYVLTGEEFIRQTERNWNKIAVMTGSNIHLGHGESLLRTSPQPRPALKSEATIERV
jgi:hypothetical protein